MKKLSVFLALISLAVFFIFSCQKDKSASTYLAGDSNNLKTTVTGIVLDESNAPLNGVTVTAYGQTTTTNQYGTFVLKNMNVNKDRCVLQFTKAGFFKRSHGFIASANTVNYVRIVMLSNVATQNFSSSVGGTVSLPDGSSAEFQPNSFVTSNGSAYSGTVNLIVKHLSPDDANFGFSIPGGDLLGKDANNKDVALYTYGMLGVELTGSSGEALQLAAGTPATLTMAIAASQLSSAPATIPLWYFDETTSLWKEEGAANKVGSNYVGTVAHFSWWNCDYCGPKSYLRGKVVDCNVVSVTNVVVSLNGCAEVNTDQNGEYNTWIPSGMLQQVQMQVLAINNNGIISNSQPENVPSLSVGQVYIVPDLLISCNTRVIGTIKSCTGEVTDGFVSVSNASYNNFQFTSNGSFSIIAPDNVQMVLNAVNATNSHSQNITTLTAPNYLNVGNVLICDSINYSSNYFILNGGPFSNQLISINENANTMSAIVYPTSYTGIYYQGATFSGFGIDFTLVAYPGLGTSPVQGCNILLTKISNGNYYYLSNLAMSSTVIQIDSVGGHVKGNYSGTCMLSGDSLNTQGYISGSFDVIRTQ